MSFDPIEAQKYLEGVDYPVSKHELIQTVESRDAPQEMIEELQAVRREQFDGPTAVQEAFARS